MSWYPRLDLKRFESTMEDVVFLLTQVSHAWSMGAALWTLSEGGDMCPK